MTLVRFMPASDMATKDCAGHVDLLQSSPPAVASDDNSNSIRRIANIGMLRCIIDQNCLPLTWGAGIKKAVDNHECIRISNA
ncbi:hypothetical protein ATY81_22090 [Rhizobium sp. R72]|nr:hypothetical protein ATY81_22090 [Rhizobium sp. R72]OWW02473.1 hypothetical protein ATY80_22090 [Rhizobium sp. R711]